MRIGLDVDDVLYRTSEMEGYFKSQGVELKNLPSVNYYDTKWVDEGAVKECLADHPNWEFVIITSRASADYIDTSLMSNGTRRKLSDARRRTKEMITAVLPCVHKFYFTEQKAACMQTNDIDVIIDDNSYYIEQVRSESTKIAIQKVKHAQEDTIVSFSSFKNLKRILEEANATI